MKSDYEKRIASLKNNLENLKDDNSLLKDVIENEIEILSFANVFGYHWPKAKRKIFLKFFDKVKDEVSLRSFKLLFANSTIIDDGVAVEPSKRMKIDLFCEYFLSSLIILAFFMLFFLSFYLPDKGFGAKFVYMVVVVFMFFLGFVPFVLTIGKQRNLKRMKVKYNGLKLK